MSKEMSTEKKPTVMDILAEVAEAFCNDYCKYPELCQRKADNTDSDEDEDYLYDHFCGDCPLNRIV